MCNNLEKTNGVNFLVPVLLHGVHDFAREQSPRTDINNYSTEDGLWWFY